MLALIAFHLLTLLTHFILARPSEIRNNLTPNERLNRSIDSLDFSRANLTTPELDHRHHPVICLPTPNENKVPQSLRALAADCRYILNEMTSQIGYVFEDVEFGNGQYRSPAGKVLPAEWVHGQCAVYVRSSFTDERAFMSLMEVILTAHRILNECLVNRKHQRGGISQVGSIVKFFYVALLGPGLGHGSITGPDSNNSSNPDLDVLKRSLNPTPLEPEASLA